MPFRRLGRRGGAIAAVALTALVGAGCGAGGEPDIERGRALFSANCSSCHALAESGSTANVGPDLDAAFEASRRDGLGASSVAGVVKYQIAHPRPTQLEPDDPRYSSVYMPADLVEGQDAEDVAAYVGEFAGTGAKPPEFTADGYFTQSCGGCHALEAAGTSGVTGPNLDETLQGKDLAYVEESIADPNAVIAQGFEAGVMPENYGDDLSADEIRQLSEYILTGEVPDSSGSSGGGSGSSE